MSDPTRLKIGSLVLEHDGSYWSGELMLRSFADLMGPKRREILVEIEAEELPSPAQQAGIRWLLAEEDAASRAVRKAIVAGYPEQRRRFGNDVPMPETLDEDALADHVDLRGVTFHEATRGRVPYIGFLFGCTWEDEHGLGLMMHGTRCVELGGADTAILGWIAERDAAASGDTARKPAKQAPAKKVAAKKIATKETAAKKTAAKKTAARTPAAKKIARKK